MEKKKERIFFSLLEGLRSLSRHTHTLSLPLRHTHAVSLSLRHTHTHSLILPNTHSHTRTLSRTQTHACTLTRSQWKCFPSRGSYIRKKSNFLRNLSLDGGCVCVCVRMNKMVRMKIPKAFFWKIRFWNL